MRQSTLILSVCASFAFAQTPSKTVKFFWPNGDQDLGADPVAEVMEANPTETVYSIGCAANVNASECLWEGSDGSSLTYSIISTTIYKATVSIEGLYTMMLSCDHNTKETAVTCDVDVDGPNAAKSMMVVSGTDLPFVTATVTKGAAMLAAAATATASAPTATGTQASTSIKGIEGYVSEIGSTPTASSSVPEFTGAAYRLGVEGSALLALAGAAVLNAW